MTSDAPFTQQVFSHALARAARHPPASLGRRAAPVVVVVLALIAIWYVAALLMNAPLVRDAFEREETAYGVVDLIAATLNAERPLLPAPHQILRNSRTRYSAIRRIRRAASSITAG